MEFDGFTTVDVQPKSGPGFVYVLCWVTPQGDEVPFYVGQTISAWQRLNDYYWADFGASTDFKVGEAMKHLHAKGYPIVAKYRASVNLRQDEKTCIARLGEEKRRLLNDKDSPGYNYQTTKEADERKRIQEFVDELLRAAQQTISD
jgi:hypothetical protein